MSPNWGVHFSAAQQIPLLYGFKNFILWLKYCIFCQYVSKRMTELLMTDAVLHQISALNHVGYDALD